jgi:hypothetical protein
MSRPSYINKILTEELLQVEYKELQSFRKIGEKYNISRETVRYYCKKYNIETNPLIRYNCDNNFFTIENELTFYVAGFIAADGCVKIRKAGLNTKRYELQFGLAKKDREFLQQLKTILKTDAPINDSIVRNSERNPKWNDTLASHLTITSEKLVKDLAKYNIVPRKSLIYTFPEWLINHPLVHHFMRGYNDGDGSFYVPKLAEGKYTKQIHFSLRGTPEFLEIYRSILEHNCSLKTRIKDIRISSGHGCLEYGGNGILSKIVQFLYRDATMFLPRKKQIIQHLL